MNKPPVQWLTCRTAHLLVMLRRHFSCCSGKYYSSYVV